MARFVENRLFRIARLKFMQRLLFASLLFVVAVCTGITGFIIIEGYSLRDALYMTIITISTVGYGEIRPLSDEGKLFTSILIIFNIGILATVVSVISAFIFEADLESALKTNQMEKDIRHLKGHVIVCGYGRLGRTVSKDLTEHGMQVLIVEQDEKAIEELLEHERLYLEGDATDDETVGKMRIRQATTLITTFHSDASNIYVVLAAREISKDIRIISRASSEANISKLRIAGADHIIIPEDISGSYVAAVVTGKEKIETGKLGY